MVKYLVEPEPSPTAALGEITWGVIMTSTRLWAPWERGAPGPLQVVWDGARMDGEPGLGDRTRGMGIPRLGQGCSCCRYWDAGRDLHWGAGLGWNQQAAEQEHPGREHTRK